MQLVAASDGELEAVAALINSAYRGESSRQGWTTEADYLDGQRIDAEALRAEFAANPGAIMLVLREADDHPLLGCVWLAPDGSDAWYLGMFTIRPDLQDRQLGRGLLAEAEAFARGRGARCMRMQVVSIRDTLIAWYARRGYAPTGEMRPFPYDSRFGIAKRNDLEFIVLEKAL